MTFAPYKFIDIHYHAAPDLYVRRLDALSAGRIYQLLQGAVILKSHLGSTSVQASLAQCEGLPVFPSLVLNDIAGGIDYRVVLKALSDYQPSIPSKLLVHFPTITGRSYHSKLKRQLTHPHLSKISLKSQTVSNEQGTLRKEVLDIFKLARDYPIVLSSGHASKEEVYRLLDTATKYQLTAFLLNQPANPLTGLMADELLALSKDYPFLWVEQTLLTYLLGHQSQEDLRRVLCSLPRVIYSSDLGQTNQMDIFSWFGYATRLLKTFNVSPAREQALWKMNALRLLS